MSRILVVQPHRMLQQAFVVALFPEHQVQVLAEIPEVSADADVVIIDAAAMRERDLLTARELRRVQSWNVPIVWVDDEVVAKGSAESNSARLTAPIKRDDLRTAVAECLRSLSAPQPTKAPKAIRSVVPVAKTKHIESKPESVASGSDREFIELVDVFEETPERDDGGAEARNKD
ncbi:MAG: hypothetical protein ACREP3_19000 [Candidatus Binatia bacterium]